jgi:protein SCO1/2
MNNKRSAILGLFIAVFVPVGFWLYYNVFLGLPQPLPKLYYPMMKDTSYVRFDYNIPTFKKYLMWAEDTTHLKIKNIVYDSTKVFHTIADFKLINQNGDTITQDSFKNKIYVANFFFCSCATICPKMTKNLTKIQHEYERVKYVRILSHTVDPEHDDIGRMKTYMKKMGANEKSWDFVTGSRDQLYNLCKNSYFLAVQADGPESFDHSEKLVLIDNHKIIRGVYDGTDTVAVEKLRKDMISLLKELAKDVNELKPPKD